MMSLGDRMRTYYEQPAETRLPMRMPAIIRLDGRAFHTWTKDLEKPFDAEFVQLMAELARHLCKEIPTVQMAYVQSDEISLLLHNYKRHDSQAFFNNEAQKIASVAAGIASAFFTLRSGRLAVFDARVFVLPEAEVANYFIWRQQDAIRNSINALAQSMYPQAQLQGKDQDGLRDMIRSGGKEWHSLLETNKKGLVVHRDAIGWMFDWEIPVFTGNREYIEKHLAVEE